MEAVGDTMTSTEKPWRCRICHSWIPADVDECTRCESAIDRLAGDGSAPVRPAPDVPPPKVVVAPPPPVAVVAPPQQVSRRPGLQLDVSPAPAPAPAEAGFYSGLAKTFKRSNSNLEYNQEEDLMDDEFDDDPSAYQSCTLDEQALRDGIQTATAAKPAVSGAYSSQSSGGGDQLVVSDDEDDSAPSSVSTAPAPFLSCSEPGLPTELAKAMMGKAATPAQAPPQNFFAGMGVAPGSAAPAPSPAAMMTFNEGTSTNSSGPSSSATEYLSGAMDSLDVSSGGQPSGQWTIDFTTN